MAEETKTPISLSYTQLQELLSAALSAANKPNPLEQKRLEEELERERRRAALSVELGRAEEEARWRRQNMCSHSANEKTGESVPFGRGKYTTGGQIHGDDAATLICQRCSTVWRFIPTREERDYILNGPGLLGYAPPPLERCLNKDDFAPRPMPRPVEATL